MIEFTQKAIEKTRKLLEDEDSAMRLRVFVQGGGCSGFEYGFTFDDTTEDDDTIINQNGIGIVVDAMSSQYVSGSTVDYVEDLSGASFTVNNPNAQTVCGCGNSFQI